MILAALTAGDYLLLPPICLAIALVTSAAHREKMSDILRHAMRSWLILMGGIVLFMFAQTFFFEFVLP